MLSRIALLVHENQYHSKLVFTQSLSDALRRTGVSTEVIVASQASPAAIKKLKSTPPDLTASFSRIDRLRDGRFLWDHLEIPHVNMLLDPAIYYMDFRDSPYSLISCVDEGDCEAISATGFDRVFFLPHAAEDFSQITFPERPYDIVFLGSCYDYESIREVWQRDYPEVVGKVIEKAVDLLLSDHTTALTDALWSAWNEYRLDSNQYNFIQICWFVDCFARGYERIRQVKELAPFSVHVFGEMHQLTRNTNRDWNFYFKDYPHVTIHPALPFEKSLAVLAQAKFSLNSSPMFKRGTHERVFNSMAAGAVAITDINSYLEKQFRDESELLFYERKDFKKLIPKIQYLLDNPRKRDELAEQGRCQAVKYHSWDQRAQQFIEALNRK